jgi:serine/threonine protein kinase/WD40 repeat protein
MNAIEDDARTIFLAALEVPADEWPALLDKTCGENSELRMRVDQLLCSHQALGSIHTRRTTGPGFTADTPPLAERPGTLIGPYKLLERIGEGGMGEVWMAEQRQPMQRRVALKIIKAGMDTRSVVARFEAERQALALMDHPNIAKVLDGGTTDGCRPFFVMELVKGTPITQYCDEHRLTLRERLELFLPVCQAIQHAHQKGIIHRDIKPSNVLIAPYDGRPVPKIIDFGVAKAMGQRLTERTLYTGFGSVIGTLEYMSPEQAELNNQDIDTRSDIYALGVVLYELLTGTTPISHERVTHAAFVEMLRVVREEEPPRPSTRLSDSQETLPIIADQRHIEPIRLTKLVRGELDWIVMKALEKDRTRRYETASSLARDIESYLHDKPVHACPPTAGYRLRKFARRHKGPVTAVSLVALAVTAGIIGTTWGLVRTERARGQLREQQIKTRAAERDTTWEQAMSHWKEARIAHAARQPGQRWRSLEALAAAVHELRSLGRLDASRAELRDDAIASLTLWDVRPVKRLSGTPGLPGPVVDPLGRHYANMDAPNLISWRRLADDQVVHRWQLEGGVVVGLDVSPDGRYIWGDCHDGPRGEKPVGRVWDSTSGELVLHRHIPSGWHSFRPGARVLALVQADGSLALCDLTTRLDLPPLPARPGLDGLQFDPTGQYLAVSTEDPRQTEVWDLAARKVVLRLPDDHYAGNNLAWSPDGSLLAIASGDGGIYLRSFPAGTIHTVLRGHEHAVIRIAYHPSGRLLASSSHDDTTRLWCFSPGGELILPGERAPQFSRDGRWLVTASREGVTLWEICDAGDCLRYLPYGKGPLRGAGGIAFAPDNRLLASASMDGVLLWDAAAARQIGRVPSGPGYELAFAAHGQELLTSGPDGVMRWPIVRDRGGRAVRVGPGTVLRATAADPLLPHIDVDHTARLLLRGSGDGAVDLVPLAEPAKARRLGIHTKHFAVALSPDGRWAVSTGHHGDSTRVWDAAQAALVHRLPDADEYCFARFSRDGRTLITGDRARIRFWEVGSWKLKATRSCDPRSLFCHVAFSRDGKLLALCPGRNRIELCDAATLRRQASLETPAGPVSLTGLCLSPDGTWLAATTDDNVIALWHLRQIRQELASLNLDWEMPPYPLSGNSSQGVEALTAEILPANATDVRR